MCPIQRWPVCDAAHGWIRAAATTLEGHPAIELCGPTITTQSFSEVIPSWAANTSGQSWIEVEVRVCCAGQWSHFFRIARWDARLNDSRRTSFDAQSSTHGHVAVDTFLASNLCQAAQPRVLLVGTPEPTLHSFTLAFSSNELWNERDGSAATQPRHMLQHTSAAIPEIPVPLRSQMVYPNGGSVWCSPTCVTMLLAYWYEQTGDNRLAPYTAHSAIPELAVPYCFDPAYKGTGNWIFNTAFAASLGLDVYVTRLESIHELRSFLAAGVPVVISVAWAAGELTGAAINESDGHLLIVTGLDGEDGVYVADPAGSNAGQVRRCYNATELARAWIGNSHGTVYIIHPYNHL